jgi:hypothetical protein
MSELSEEKIIEEFKELIYNPDYDEILLCTEDGFTGWHELFENILELYNKEKEKNKILDNMLLVNKEQYEFIKNKDNYISKDKIRELIQDIDETIYITKSDEVKFYMLGFKNSIQELLEERN